MALHADRTELRFRSLIAGKHLGEAFEKDRILFRERIAGISQERRRIDADGGKGVDHDRLGPRRIPRMHENRVCVLPSDAEREKFLAVNDAEIVWC